MVPNEEHWQRILDAKRSVDNAEQLVADAKDNLDEARGALKGAESHRDSLVNELRSVIEDAHTGQGHFGFDDDAENDDWRQVGLESLNLSSRDAKALSDANIITIGDLSGFKGDLVDIKGIGEAAAERITAALDAYWESHPVAEDVEA